jgi:hypothetical protein
VNPSIWSEVSTRTTNARAVTYFRIALAILLTAACAPSQQKDLSAGISLQGLLRFFEGYRGGTVSEMMVIRLIEMYGLDFRPAPEDLTKLRKVSASDALIHAVEGARKPPPPKPVARTGHLAVVCEPVDCDVRVNGDPAGKTDHGLLPWLTRPEGRVTVTAAREDYEPVEGKQEAQIRPNEVVEVTFVFKPSRAARVTAGAALFQQMLESLGDDGKQPATFRATGTIYVQDAGEHRTAWSLGQWLQLTDLSRFEVSRLREKYQITLTNSGFQWKKSPKTKDAQELERLVRLILDHRLARLVDQFRDSRFTKVALDPVSFQVEGNPETYAVTLDSAHRPAEIGVAGLKVLYSDYVQQGAISYPKTTQIIQPDGITGLELRIDTLQAAPSESQVKRPRLRH